jgi:hypothetical protein
MLYLINTINISLGGFMLELAFLNKEKLSHVWTQALTANLFYYYFMEPSLRYTIDIPDSDRYVVQYVSKDKNGNIIGFFAGYVNHIHDMIENIDIINFTQKVNLVFSKDLIDFFAVLLLKKGFRKAVFRAVADNPASIMYERFITRHNIGCKIGVLKQNRKLEDGNYYDEVIYEVFKHNFAAFFSTLKQKPIPSILYH